MADRLKPVSLVAPVKVPRDPFVMRRRPPVAVQVSFWVLAALAALDSVRLAVILGTFDWDAYLAKEAHPFVRNGHEIFMTPGTAIGVRETEFAGSFALVGFSFLLAFGIRAAKRWARLVQTAFIVIQRRGPFPCAPAVSGPRWRSLATLGAVVLLWLPRSRAFFRQAKADRKAHKLKQLY